MNCLDFKISKLFFPILILSFFIQLYLPAQASEKPLFVEISTQWCYACNLLKPTVQELENQYSGDVDFILLDATSDETINASRQLASQYGVSDYFDANRNVFPKVAIMYPNSSVPAKVIIGANSKDTYVQALGEILAGGSSEDSGRPKTASTEPDKSKENTSSNLIDRPLEAAFPERPGEVNFWEIGDQIPYYSYFQFVKLPECANNASILCFHRDTAEASQGTDEAANVNPKEKDMKGLKVVKK